MIKQLFTKTKTQALPINLGKGPYVQTALQTEAIHLLITQKPFEITWWATYKFYKPPKARCR